MCAVVFLICYAVFAWLDSYTLHGQVIEVPTVCGKHIDDAAEALRARNLDFEVIDYKYKKNGRENEVVEQLPLPGAQVKKGRKIQAHPELGKRAFATTARHCGQLLVARGRGALACGRLQTHRRGEDCGRDRLGVFGAYGRGYFGERFQGAYGRHPHFGCGQRRGAAGGGRACYGCIVV